MTKHVEADEFGAFARRVMRAYGRRVADRDIGALGGLAQLRADVDEATRHAVDSLRVQGYSWADIGRELGVTRQAAQQKWGRPTPAAVEPEHTAGCSCGARGDLDFILEHVCPLGQP